MSAAAPALPEVVGHQSALAELRGLWADGAGPRTLLIAGPEGVGRRAVAHWLAAYVNCSGQTHSGSADPRPCGACASCLAAAAGTHVDVRELAPATRTKSGRSKQRGEITIDRVVQRPNGDPEPLTEWLRTRPRHRFRVAIVDGAEALTEGAANAFLKTLEEPPSWALIVLIATGRDALLPTVASRCTVLRLGPVSLPGFEDLAGHPGLTLGQPGALLRARAAPAPSAAARRAADELLAALDGDLLELMDAAEALAKAIGDANDAGVRPGPLGWLIEPLRARGAAAYAANYDALARCEEALSGYVQGSLACTVLALELRLALRLAGG